MKMYEKEENLYCEFKMEKPAERWWMLLNMQNNSFLIVLLNVTIVLDINKTDLEFDRITHSFLW